MSEIQKIIKFLDDTIEKRGITHLSPVEGNKILDEAGLLNDSSDRPGLPLRRLLRSGRIPYAYQLGGKNSPWFIPQSSKFKSRTQQSSLQTEKTKTDTPKGCLQNAKTLLLKTNQAFDL
mgnify:CR=1 FL=1